MNESLNTWVTSSKGRGLSSTQILHWEVQNGGQDEDNILLFIPINEV